MARYIGPKWRINRRENATILGDDSWKRRQTPPGQHGASRSRRPSEYAIQFREKQKVKRTYGLFEKQFKKIFKMAQKATGNTGTRFLQLLEMRLDNIVYRLKFAKTRAQARQFITHGNIMVNGKRLNIPSYTVRVGDRISLSKKLKDSELIKMIQVERKIEKLPKWLAGTSSEGEVVAMPIRADMDNSIKEQLIVELYSR